MFLFGFIFSCGFCYVVAQIQCSQPNTCMLAVQCFHFHDRTLKHIPQMKCKQSNQVCCRPLNGRGPRMSPETTSTTEASTTLRIIGRRPSTGNLPCGQRPGYQQKPTRTIEIENKIFRGQHASAGQFPWMAFITIFKSGSRVGTCGATIISEVDVLSADHCFPTNADRIEVKMGMTNLDAVRKCNNPNCMPITREGKVFRYKKSNSSKSLHDIALVRLNESIPFNDVIQPACLPTFHTNYSKFELEEESLSTAGWGTVDEGRENSRKLKWANQTVYTKAKCRKIYEEVKLLDSVGDDEICTLGRKKARGMSGDSGGPLLALQTRNNIPSYVVVGVFSRGANVFREKRIPVVYTNVQSYLLWIRRNGKGRKIN